MMWRNIPQFQQEFTKDVWYSIFSLLWRYSPTRTRAASFLRFLDHNQWHTTVGSSYKQGIGPSHRPLPQNTQHSQETDIHAPGGIRTNNTNKRSAADPRLRPLCHWDQQHSMCLSKIIISILYLLNKSQWSNIAVLGVDSCKINVHWTRMRRNFLHDKAFPIRTWWPIRAWKHDVCYSETDSLLDM